MHAVHLDIETDKKGIVPIVLLTCDIHRSFICLLPWSTYYSEDNAQYWEQSSNQPDWLEQM